MGRTADLAPGAQTTDRIFAGSLILHQPGSGHRAGTDAVLLAAATPACARRIADLGAATGVVGLRAAQLNSAARVLLIERAPELAALAAANIAANSLADRVETRVGDVFRLGAEPALRETFDCVLTNPPYLDASEARISPDRLRAQAHMLEGSLADWLRGAIAILAPKGRLIMIHRADRLAEVLGALGRRAGALRLRFVHADGAGPAIRLLVSATKGSRAPLAVLPPIVLNENGGFTPEAAALHAGEARISLDPDQ